MHKLLERYKVIEIQKFWSYTAKRKDASVYVGKTCAPWREEGTTSIANYRMNLLSELLAAHMSENFPGKS